MISEKSLGKDFDFASVETGLGDKFNGFICRQCAAFVAVVHTHTWTSCPFCAHEEADPFLGQINTVRPSAILPFNFPKSKAKVVFKNWAKGLFAPGMLQEAAREPHIKGVYIPYWNFEAMTRSSWKAVQLIDLGKGKKAKQPVQGFFEHFFEDHQQYASAQIHPVAWKSMGPYPIDQAVPYNPKYLDGKYVEILQQGVQDVVKGTEKGLEKRIRDQIVGSKKKANLQNMSVRSQKQLLDIKLILLPVWVAIYGSGEDLTQILINGFSGHMEAERPYSMTKVAIGVLIAVLGTIGFIILLNNLI